MCAKKAVNWKLPWWYWNHLPLEIVVGEDLATTANRVKPQFVSTDWDVLGDGQFLAAQCVGPRGCEGAMLIFPTDLVRAVFMYDDRVRVAFF